MPRSHDLTLRAVLQAVRAVAVNDEAPRATVVHMRSSSHVRRRDEAITAMMAGLASVDAAA